MKPSAVYVCVYAHAHICKNKISFDFSEVQFNSVELFLVKWDFFCLGLQTVSVSYQND